MEYFFSDKFRSSPAPLGPAGSCPYPGTGRGFAPDLLLPLPCLLTSTRIEKRYAQGNQYSTYSHGSFIVADGDQVPSTSLPKSGTYVKTHHAHVSVGRSVFGEAKPEQHWIVRSEANSLNTSLKRTLEENIML